MKRPHQSRPLRIEMRAHPRGWRILVRYGTNGPIRSVAIAETKRELCVALDKAAALRRTLANQASRGTP